MYTLNIRRLYFQNVTIETVQGIPYEGSRLDTKKVTTPNYFE